MNNSSYSPENLVASARKRAASRHYHNDYYGFRRKFQKVTNSGYNFDGSHSNETIDKAAEYSLKLMLINEYLGISGSNTLPENRYLSNNYESNYESIDKLTQLLKNEHGGIGRRPVSILPRYDPRSKRESGRMSNARRVSNDRQKYPRDFSSPTVPGDVSPHSRNMTSMNNSPLSVRDFNRSKDQDQDGKKITSASTRKTENERTNTPEIYQEPIETSEKTQSSSGKRNIAKFEERFNHLLKFKAENGHCNPPSTPTSKHASLGKWANHVRLSYRQLKNKTQPHIRLTDSHIKQLSDIGFVWELRKKSFEVRFQELTDFKAKHGHCNVPTSRSSEYFSLGEWCRRLKQSHARMLDNRKPLSSSIRLTKERIQELEAIGFDLKVKKRK